jgi:hypothetical protein
MEPETLQAKAPAGTRGSATAPANTRPPSAEALLARIRALLRTGEVCDARRLAATAAAEHPGKPDLRRIHELLNTGQARRRPGTGRSVRQEVEWLRDPPEELRGKWIAVLDQEIIASAACLNELMTQLPPHQEPKLLVLQIEA